MPNVGYETIGTVGTRPLNSNLRGLTITMPAAGAAGVTITAYVEDVSGAGEQFRAAIIDPADGVTVLASSTIRTDISTAGWYTFSGNTFASFTPVNGASYIICVGSTAPADSGMYYDGSSATSWVGWTGPIATMDPLTLPFSDPDVNRDYSIYLTYTPARRRFILN